MEAQAIMLIFCCLASYLSVGTVDGVEILSKSKLEKCEKGSDSSALNCTSKIVLNLAVPSGSSGGEASIVAEIVEVEDSTSNMKTLRIPPLITINKSSAYAQYELSYIRDVAYKPEEYYAETRKCEPNAGKGVVKICERLRDENGHIIEYTEPTCCPCGPQRRIPSSCDNWLKNLVSGGKRNTAHCVRFPGDWFHVFGIGQQSIGFSVRIEVKTKYKVSEVIVGPENRTAISKDNFLRVNLIGDFVGYTSLPSFEDFYLVIPRQADQNRIERKQLPLYGLEGRFERINQHPNAGTRSFSIGITEVLNTNLLMELRADDIEFVFQRSPGKILNVTIPTFEALTQFGVATITAKNTGEVEASYSLTFDCSRGVSLMEEQFFIMKPNGIATQWFKLYPTTDQAAKYVCEAILKDSNFNEVDRAECQFSTTATILDNGSQTTPLQPSQDGVNGFLESTESIWSKFWEGLVEFIIGKTCRRKCASFFDFSCHIQYICMSWMVMFGLLLAIFPIVLVLLWLLHQKGFFDPLYDWWEDHVWDDNHRSGHRTRHKINIHHHHIHVNRHHELGARHHKHDAHHKRRSTHQGHKHNHSGRETDYYYYLHHVHKDKNKHRITKKSRSNQQVYLDGTENDKIGHHKHGKEKKVYKDHLED
ncbi:protein HAPLESS 2-like isoform X2 [Euphorbia lathyris]|uniref:protein HAPLESS 2-like isoform X2 n=1 Tax=Euphorbia lathyris TaxID=212925 RepID=UPI003313D150